ncbi:MAG: hypothetical protein ACRDX8_08875 [Acidimicrobiales bacterium]
MLDAGTQLQQGTGTALSSEGLAELYLRLLAESELRRATRNEDAGEAGSSSVRAFRMGAPSPSGGGPHQSKEVGRLRVAVGVLAAVGAVDESVGESVVMELETALAARGLLPAPMLLPRQRRGPTARGLSDSGSQGLPLVSTGQVRVASVGATLLLDDGHSLVGELHLMAMVALPGRIVLTVVAHGSKLARTGRALPVSPVPLHRMDAVYQNGTPGDLQFVGSAADERWEGALELLVAPDLMPAWLDVGPGAGGARVRVRLDLPSQPTLAELAQAAVAPTSRGERLLEAAAEALLGDVQGARASVAALVWDLDVAVGALRAVDELAADSPAPGRLCALARILGFDVMTGGAHPSSVPDAELPEQWASVLVERGRREQREGPEGLAPVAVVLPEIEGATFVLGGLQSTPEDFRLHVCALGWKPDPSTWLRRALGGDLAFSWWAQEPSGRWHLGLIDGWEASGDTTGFRLRFAPPLDVRSRWLELVVSGRTSRVSARIGLRWEAAW